MSEAPQPNTPEARTTTGEIKDQTQTKPITATQTTTTEAAPDAKPVDATTEPAGDDKSSLVNKPDPAKPEGAPDKYETFKAPEGYVLNDSAISEAAPLFKELGLSQSQAQRLVDFYAKTTVEAAKAQMETIGALRNEWRDKVKADPEIGTRLPEVKTTIGRALDSLGDSALTKEFREAMDLTGAGDNPAFIKTFYRMAKQFAEGQHVNGGGPSAHGQAKPGQSAKPSLAQAMYPNHAS